MTHIIIMVGISMRNMVDEVVVGQTFLSDLKERTDKNVCSTEEV